MAKRSLPEKRPLPSLDDDREIIRVQKEPQKVLQPLEPLRIDMNAVVQNVQEQFQQTQQSQILDDYITDGFIQHGTQPTFVQLIHPPVDDTTAMQQQDDQQPLEIVNGPIVAPQLPAGEFDMSNREARMLYEQLVHYRGPFIPPDDVMTEIPGRGFTVHYNVPTTKNDINIYLCDIDFKALRVVAVNDTFRERIVTTCLDEEQQDLLKATNIPISQLQVYWVLDPELKAKKYTTQEYLEYFRKLFFLMAVDKNLEYFVGDQHGIASSRRVNLTRTCVTWNCRETEFNGFQGFASGFTNNREKFLSDDVENHYPECAIHHVDVSHFTATMEVENRRVYFQVVCTENNVYIITNMFHDTSKRYLPKVDEPFSFTYQNKLQKGEFEMRAHIWRRGLLLQTQLDDDTPYKYKLTHGPKKWRRKIKPPELVYIINFKFDFLFPTALAQRNVEKGVDDPMFFTDINRIARNDPVYWFDPVMIFANDWQILHDFILTFLCPEQFILPTATGSVEGNVDEQHVDQPVEQSTGQQIGQPIMDQMMEHADQRVINWLQQNHSYILEDTTSNTECPPEHLMELEEEQPEEIGNVSQLPPIYSQ